MTSTSTIDRPRFTVRPGTTTAGTPAFDVYDTHADGTPAIVQRNFACDADAVARRLNSVPALRDDLVPGDR